MKRYADEPLHVRLSPIQEGILNKIIGDEKYCYEHGIYSKSDIVRRSLTSVCKHYEQITQK